MQKNPGQTTQPQPQNKLVTPNPNTIAKSIDINKYRQPKLIYDSTVYNRFTDKNWAIVPNGGKMASISYGTQAKTFYFAVRFKNLSGRIGLKNQLYELFFNLNRKQGIVYNTKQQKVIQSIQVSQNFQKQSVVAVFVDLKNKKINWLFDELIYVCMAIPEHNNTNWSPFYEYETNISGAALIS